MRPLGRVVERILAFSPTLTSRPLSGRLTRIATVLHGMVGYARQWCSVGSAGPFGTRFYSCERSVGINGAAPCAVLAPVRRPPAVRADPANVDAAGRAPWI